MAMSHATLATNTEKVPEIHDDANKVPTYDTQTGPPGLWNKRRDAVTQKGNQENPFVRKAEKYEDVYEIHTYDAQVGPPGLGNKRRDAVTQKGNKENPFVRKDEKYEDVYEMPTYRNPYTAPGQRNEFEGVNPRGEAQYTENEYEQNYYEAIVGRNVTDGNTPEIPGPNSSGKTPFIIALLFLWTVCIIQMVLMLIYIKT